MSAFVIWVLVAAVVFQLPAASALRDGPGSGRDQRTEDYLAGQGLALPPDLRQQVLSRLRLRSRAAIAWGWGGWAAGVAMAVAAQAVGAAHVVPLITLLATALGHATGAIVGLMREVADPLPTAPRVARARATTWREYCDRWDRRAALLSVLATAIACIAALGVWALTPLRPDGGWLVPAAVIAAGVCVGVAEILCLRLAVVLADRPQRAHSDLELAWDDALRSGAVRGVLDVVVGTGLLATLVVLGTSATWLIAPEVRARGMELTALLGLAALLVGLVCWAVILVPWRRGRRVRNPSLGLWRDHDLSASAQGGRAC
ncbi:hypothetical protein SAMN05216355_101195 [Actinomyces ruminicola]|uniref:Uncharacterized protein n=1 Tax=Actinomyces ruminicola TaxID=332524 RepID=A0A1G9ZH75_9ACTO|nr:hypothetical protein [Actinomyces ruminicola]SDN20391.1 hypothetical protein SAMN05216355_101195 [Actinomyces ruminicola]